MKKPHGKQVVRKISIPREVDLWLAKTPLGASAWISGQVAMAIVEERAADGADDAVTRDLAAAFGLREVPR